MGGKFPIQDYLWDSWKFKVGWLEIGWGLFNVRNLTLSLMHEWIDSICSSKQFYSNRVETLVSKVMKTETEIIENQITFCDKFAFWLLIHRISERLLLEWIDCCVEEFIDWIILQSIDETLKHWSIKKSKNNHKSAEGAYSTPQTTQLVCWKGKKEERNEMEGRKEWNHEKETTVV